MLFPWLCATFIRSNVTAPTQVIGLSKFNRIVHHICERPQIQEEMTTQKIFKLRTLFEP